MNLSNLESVKKFSNMLVPCATRDDSLPATATNCRQCGCAITANLLTRAV